MLPILRWLEQRARSVLTLLLVEGHPLAANAAPENSLDWKEVCSFIRFCSHQERSLTTYLLPDRMPVQYAAYSCSAKVPKAAPRSAERAKQDNEGVGKVRKVLPHLW
jgi:hypothetical protein